MTMEKTYDVAIIGAGVVGAAIARRLSRYELAVVLIDKAADVGFGTSKANSGIVHAGFHTPYKYLKTRLEVQGNLMFDQLQKELDFPFRRCGILAVAFREEELKTVETLYRQGVENGAIGIEICGRSRLLELEPKLNPDVIGGLHGVGLAWGLVITKPGTKEIDPDLAHDVVRIFIESCLMLFDPVGTGATIKVTPPLVITEEALREGLGVLADAVEAALALRAK